METKKRLKKPLSRDERDSNKIKKSKRSSFLTKLFLLISIFIFLGKSAPSFAAFVSMESYETEETRKKIPGASNAFVSTEITESSVDYILRQEADLSNGRLLSWERDTGFTGTFVVREEVKETDRGLVHSPNALDMKIVEILGNENIASVEDYVKWLDENIKHKDDEEGDIWALPEETLARGYGDCEDFAFLNKAVLRVFGYNPKAMGLLDGIILPSHAVCIFEKDGKYQVLDHAKLIKTEATSVEEFKELTIAKTLYYKVYEINQADGSENELIDLGGDPQ